ncbi:hypothetical protein F3Y22_tig00110325pilonHSYRG00126 [Hibiscus syriacus]|uniref:Bet v I/Major latex protein domain-containing protein n=1 Tax=Hibiscus syriacus TaxID=106335 RepID=A0A6A3B4P9_HIBSY|nr:hypothetical protein F3Y22_tig00110325pilonHSYRG00126 [Hibiscus syriacus]
MASSPLTGKLEFDVEIDATPEQFHHMWAHRPHHVHHTSSEKVQACDIHEGEFGKPGVTICWKYVHEGKAKTAKQVVDYDHDNKSIVFTMLEGCVAHWILEYEMLHEGIGHPESMRQFFIELARDMGAHLVKEK